MLKKLILLIACSLLIVLFMSYAQTGIHYLLIARDWISQGLNDVFAGGHTGKVARDLIALISIPFLIGFIPTMLYWAIRRNWSPYFMDIVWIVWLIQAGAIVVSAQMS